MCEIRHVEVQDMLEARDARVQRQRDFLHKYACSLVSFTMNIAGSVKLDAAIERAFAEGERRIVRQLERMGVRVVDRVRIVEYTGCEAIWAVHADAGELKNKMVAVEEADELGRLFDIDVIDADGRHLNRSEERKCLICGGPVRACARSRAHSADELFARAHGIIGEYFRARFCRETGEKAQRALLHEALTTPKPGLVDCENSGAHRDMDLFSFADSACVLRNCFENCVRIGMDGADFQRLQYVGLEAEDAMHAAVGANTHKGAIFSMGILCCAAGYCGEGASMDDVIRKAAELGKHALVQMEQSASAKTGGEMQYHRYGLTGARGEAASGFASVREIALPALEKALDEGCSLNDAGLHALMALMAQVKDSNIIRRSGMEGQEWVSAQACKLLQAGFTADDLRQMNDAFVARNISPGGSADLLAVAYFLHFLQE